MEKRKTSQLPIQNPLKYRNGYLQWMHTYWLPTYGWLKYSGILPFLLNSPIVGSTKKRSNVFGLPSISVFYFWPAKNKLEALAWVLVRMWQDLNAFHRIHQVNQWVDQVVPAPLSTDMPFNREINQVSCYRSGNWPTIATKQLTDWLSNSLPNEVKAGGVWFRPPPTPHQ